LPRGTRIEVTGAFDNSANNKYNPDAKATVRWGDQSWEEMLAGFIQMTVDPATDVFELVGAPKPSAQKLD